MQEKIFPHLFQKMIFWINFDNWKLEMHEGIESTTREDHRSLFENQEYKILHSYFLEYLVCGPTE